MSRRKKARQSPMLLVATVAVFLIAVFIGFHYHVKNTNPNPATLPSEQSTPTATLPEPSISPSNTPEKLSISSDVPILMYHYIRTVDPNKDKLGYGLSVTPDQFEQQLHWLSSNEYQTTSLNTFCTDHASLPAKPIILTFDDGYQDAYTNALPILKKYSYIGTFFIIKNKIDKPAYMSTVQINEMAASGMEIASHTVNHKDLEKASAEVQKAELNQSKQNSMVLAYPSGKYSQTTVQLAKEAGYNCAVTTLPGIANYNSPLFELPRVRISGGESLDTFIKSLTEK